jgi:hypothetical protein
MVQETIAKKAPFYVEETIHRSLNHCVLVDEDLFASKYGCCAFAVSVSEDVACVVHTCMPLEHNDNDCTLMHSSVK